MVHHQAGHFRGRIARMNAGRPFPLGKGPAVSPLGFILAPRPISRFRGNAFVPNRAARQAHLAARRVCVAFAARWDGSRARVSSGGSARRCR